MATLITGDRIGRFGKLAVGCSAAVFDASDKRILLIRRIDNGLWAVPGGYMEPGESTTEACVREVREETGLNVSVTRLISLYTDPNALLEYPDGNRWQLIVLHFAASIDSGEFQVSDETTEMAFFTLEEAQSLPMGHLDQLRVSDSFSRQAGTIVRDAISAPLKRAR
jgi:ADP-ribose pyrophosphatase YjhB (NUDIX family)